ncbi:MAG: hypothetical protein FJ403_24390, partial [Verrucomicrobia bacterium]|nr:hypothetical protein [Verrucomicrobiota bacterium]
SRRPPRFITPVPPRLGAKVDGKSHRDTQCVTCVPCAEPCSNEANVSICWTDPFRHRAWAPRGADHFYGLARDKFYDGVKFHRVIRQS